MPAVPPMRPVGASAALRRGVLGAANTVRCPRTYAAMPSQQRMIREMERAAKRDIKKTSGASETMSQMQKRSNDEYFTTAGGPLFPGTFIPLQLSKYPRDFGSLFRYQYARCKQWGFEKLSLMQFKLKSMPNWTTRPQWKIGRSKIAPTAKVMYSEMMTAYASGDKATIQSLCLGNFSNKLTAAIDRRPRTTAGNFFNLKRFTKPLFFPRVVAHQVHNVNPFDKESATEQAVVAISSLQEAARLDAAGNQVPGTFKTQDKVEYVVLSRQVSEKSYQAGPWKIWGTVPATTLEAYEEEQAWIMKEQAKRSGWTGPVDKK